MIISASYKTDIPTFYGQWFINRLRAGYCKLLNPFNKRVSVVDFTEADAFVFWTKNLGPFIEHLPEVWERGYPFVVQYTITGYPHSLERAVVRPEDAVRHMHDLRERYGRRVGVWRYDTILATSLTPYSWHVDNFRSLASEMAGATDEVVVSFAQMYRKTERNLEAAARDHGFEWTDPEHDEKQELALDLADIALAYGLRLTMCGQRELLTPGILDARCIDAERLSEVAGHPIRAKLEGHRKECGCYASKDIGAYETCPHGCVYCYAVTDTHKARDRFREHDPNSEFLCPDEAEYARKHAGESAGRARDSMPSQQPRLMD